MSKKLVEFRHRQGWAQSCPTGRRQHAQPLAHNQSSQRGLSGASRREVPLANEVSNQKRPSRPASATPRLAAMARAMARRLGAWRPGQPRKRASSRSRAASTVNRASSAPLAGSNLDRHRSGGQY